MNYVIPLEQRQKLIYLTLLKYNPLTAGELAFIIKIDIIKVEEELDKLVQQKLVTQLNKLYIALPPSKLLYSTVNSQLENYSSISQKFLNQSQKKRDTLNQKILSDENDFLSKLNTIKDGLITNQKKYLVENETNINDIVLKQSTAQKHVIDGLLENSKAFRTKTDKEIEQTIDKFINQLRESLDRTDALKEQIKDSTSKSKNVFKKLLQETINALEEGANILGSSIQDQIKGIEDRLIGSLHDSISSSVNLAQELKENLINEVTKGKKDNLGLIVNLQSTDQKFISQSSVLFQEKLSEAKNKIIDQLIVILKEYKLKLDDYAKTSLDAILAKQKMFSISINKLGEEFLHEFTNVKNSTQKIFNEAPTKFYSFTETIRSKLSVYLEQTFLNYEKNIRSLDKLLFEFYSKSRTQLEKEYQLFTGENQDILDQLE